jgi:hypothetical protein
MSKVDKLLIALFLICSIIVIATPIVIIRYVIVFVVFAIMQISILGGFGQ